MHQTTEVPNGDLSTNKPVENKKSQKAPFVRPAPFGIGCKGTANPFNPKDMKPKVTSYAGMLDQNGFKQWYKYLKLRISYRFEIEEVSFLMSKPPFYFRDYAMLAAGAKIKCEDEAALSAIFYGQRIEQLNFDKDNYGAFEKRVIRVRQEESSGEIRYLITIPWIIKGKDNASKLRLREEKQATISDEENTIYEYIGIAMNTLVRQKFFQFGRSALDVYYEVKERCQRQRHLRPVYVKQALYQQIKLNNLTLKTVSGQLQFQEKI